MPPPQRNRSTSSSRQPATQGGQNANRRTRSAPGSLNTQTGGSGGGQHDANANAGPQNSEELFELHQTHLDKMHPKAVAHYKGSIRSKFNDLKDKSWSEIVTEVEKGGVPKTIQQTPVSTTNDFGNHIIQVQGKKAVDDAVAAIDNGAALFAAIGRSASDIVLAKQRSINQGAGLFADAKTLLQQEVHNAATYETQATTALTTAFKEVIATADDEGHGKYMIDESTLVYTPSAAGDGKSPPTQGAYSVNYKTLNGNEFTAQMSADGVPTSIESFSLTLKTEGGPQGRSRRPQNTGGRRVNEGQHRAHLIADQFRGSPERRSGNLVTTSGTYNSDASRSGMSMLWAETRIYNWLRNEAGDRGVPAEFNMRVEVAWADLTSFDDDFIEQVAENAASQEMAGRDAGSILTLDQIKLEVQAYKAKYPTTKLKRVNGMNYHVSLKLADGGSVGIEPQNPLPIGADIWLATSGAAS